MKKISAEIVADSISPQGHRITTMLLTYPRFIHGELMTHRMFSRNSASSRAIPFEKMYKMVAEDPFIPIAWQKDHKGMQGTEYFTKEINDDYDEIYILRQEWIYARDKALDSATYLHSRGLSKQICNRLLEPFMWHTVLVTSTEWDNFFELRCPEYKIEERVYRSKKDFCKNERGLVHPKTNLGWLEINKSQAEIHIQALAESMWDARNESTPKQLQVGEWHIPFGDKIDYAIHKWRFLPEIEDLWGKDMSEYGIKIATARCARLSYMTFDGEIDYEKDIKLHDQLLESKHFSPFEHCGRVMTRLEYRNFTKTTPYPDENGYTESEGWCNNFKGFIQYRYLVERNRTEK